MSWKNLQAKQVIASKGLPEAVLVQKTWRGVLARRHFSDVFFTALEASLEGDRLSSSVPTFDDDDEPLTPKGSRRREFAPSLEEAQREASYNPAPSGFAHVGGKPTRRASVATTNAGGTDSPASIRGAPRWASSAALLKSPTIGASSDEQQPTSATKTRRPSVATAALAAVAVRRPSVAVASTSDAAGAAGHRRAESNGGAPAAADDDVNDGDLEFNAATAENMSLDALRDLAKMLKRVIETRNKELIELQLRRDELRHERDFRKATVTALVAQVDRSQFVKEERKKEAKAKQNQKKTSLALSQGRASYRQSLGGMGM